MSAIMVDGSNFFNSGWLAAFLGMPRELPGQAALRTSDLQAWQDGYDMCKETGDDPMGNAACVVAFRRMVEQKQAVVEWLEE